MMTCFAGGNVGSSYGFGDGDDDCFFQPHTARPAKVVRLSIRWLTVQIFAVHGLC